MRKTAALLAPVACGLALAAAGCGGNGSAAGTTGSANGGNASASASASGTTTSGSGGVLGAHANVNNTKANSQIAHVKATLSGSLKQLTQTHSAKQAAQLATRTSARLRSEARSIRGLNVPPRARQSKRDLASSLDALASDIDSIKTNAQTGNVHATLNAATHLSTLMTVRSALQNFRAAINGKSQSS